MNAIRLIFSVLFFCLSTVAQAGLATKSWQTQKGTKVVFYQAMNVPMLDLRLAFAAGSAYEDEHFGLSALVTDLLNQGNAGLSAAQIAEELANTGAQFHAENSRDMLVLNLRSLTEDNALKQAISSFTKIINQPDFPEAAFRREKKQQLVAIEQAKQSPDSIATDAFFKALYQDHPYAHPVLGTSESVAALTREQVLRFYKQYFSGKNATLVIVGAISQAKAREIAEELTRNLPEGQAAQAIPKATPLQEKESVNIDYPSSQTVLRLGQLGIDHQSPDYFPLLVGNYILGGGSLVSRLAIEVREKRGLTYGVSSQFIPMPGDGPFLISLSTQSSRAQEALQVTLDTINNFIKQGADKEELLAAKQYLTGSFPLSLASNGQIANMLLRIAFYHLPEDYLDHYIKNIEKVSLTDIKQTFQKHLQPEKLLLTTVGRA